MTGLPTIPEILLTVQECDGASACAALTAQQDAALWTYVQTLETWLQTSASYSARAWRLCGQAAPAP